MMTKPQLLTLTLAAGKGTRMRSKMPKVLHKIAGRSMLGHVLSLGSTLNAGQQALVIGPDMDAVARNAAQFAPGLNVFVQAQQRGTADAVLAARAALEGFRGDVLVLYGDTPLLTTPTLNRLLTCLDEGAHVAVLGFEAANPTGYGRLLTGPGAELLSVREHKDANGEELKITLCNSGVLAFRVPDLVGLLSQIGNSNANGEYYLTDAIALAREHGLTCRFSLADSQEVLGVNSRDQLAQAEGIFQARARAKAMKEGATLVDPATVYFSADTKIGQDVVIEPNVVFGAGVTVEDDVTILANCYFEGAHLHQGARVGPFARLRPGASIGPGAHVGNFVEVKNVKLGAGAKANHLSYLGDGTVGAGANIGAGTIFCNYDGFNKRQTEIGERAFIGSNSSLVAPVKIGEGAYIGSGSVITKDVPAGALSLARPEQTIKADWATKFRQLMTRKKT